MYVSLQQGFHGDVLGCGSAGRGRDGRSPLAPKACAELKSRKYEGTHTPSYNPVTSRRLFLHPVCSDSTGKDFYPRFAQDKSHANRTMTLNP